MVTFDHLDFVTYGICTLSLIPVRFKPDPKSEMVTQLLFGECFNVFDKQRKNWIKIQNRSDNYIGWIDQKQCHLLDFQEMEEYSCNYAIALELSQPAFSNNHAINLAFGSHLPHFDGISFQFPGGKFNYSGQAVHPDQIKLTADYIEKIARKFLYAPHMYGGKSTFGLDSSGFIQLIYQAFGIKLPRDCGDQLHFGEVVDFVEQVKIGDLAFFEDKEGNVIHVGMLLPDREIIHVNGMTRIDRLDHQGIFNVDKRKYTHRLKVVKRLFQ